MKNHGVQTTLLPLLAALACSSSLFADHSVMIRPQGTSELFAIPVQPTDPLCNPAIGDEIQVGTGGPTIHVRALKQAPATDPYDPAAIIDRRIHSVEVAEEVLAVQEFARAKAAATFSPHPVEGLRAVKTTHAITYYLPRTHTQLGDIIHDRRAPIRYQGLGVYDDYVRPKNVHHMKTEETHGAATLYELLCALYQAHPDYTPAATPAACREEHIEAAAARADELFFWQLEGFLREADHLRMPHEIVRGVLRAYLRSPECAGRHETDGRGRISYEGHGIKKLLPIVETWGESGTNDLGFVAHLRDSWKRELTPEVYNAINRIRKVMYKRADGDPDEEVASTLAVDPTVAPPRAGEEAAPGSLAYQTAREGEYTLEVGYSLEENGRISPLARQSFRTVGKLYARDPSSFTFTEVAGKVMLDLSNKEISGLKGLETIPGIETVQILKIAHNRLDTLQPYHFERCSALEELYAFDCGLEALDARCFLGCNNLRILDLSRNRLRLLYRETLTPLGSTLEELYLNNNNLPEIPDLFNCKRLRVLDLSNNRDMKLHDVRVGHVRHVLDRCTELHTINLSGCPELKNKEIGDWFRPYQTGTKLRTLYLHGTQVNFGLNLGEYLTRQLECLSLPLGAGTEGPLKTKLAQLRPLNAPGAQEVRWLTPEVKTIDDYKLLSIKRKPCKPENDRRDAFDIQGEVVLSHLAYLQTRYGLSDADAALYKQSLDAEKPIDLIVDLAAPEASQRRGWCRRACSGGCRPKSKKAKFFVYGGACVVVAGGLCIIFPGFAGFVASGLSKASACAGKVVPALSTKFTASGVAAAAPYVMAGAAAAGAGATVIEKVSNERTKLEIAFFGYLATVGLRAIASLRALFAVAHSETTPNEHLQVFRGYVTPSDREKQNNRNATIIAAEAALLLRSPLEEYGGYVNTTELRKHITSVMAPSARSHGIPSGLGGAAYPELHSHAAGHVLNTLVTKHLEGWLPGFAAEVATQVSALPGQPEILYKALEQEIVGTDGRVSRLTLLRELLTQWRMGVAQVWHTLMNNQWAMKKGWLGSRQLLTQSEMESLDRRSYDRIDRRFCGMMEYSITQATELLNQLDVYEARHGLRT